MLNLRLRGCWFKFHRGHCVVSLSKTLYPLLSTGSTLKDWKSSKYDWNTVDWNIKHLIQSKHKFWCWAVVWCETIYGNCSKISTLGACQKAQTIYKQCRPRSDCFWRSSLINVFPVCYYDKHLSFPVLITNILLENRKRKVLKYLEHLLKMKRATVWSSGVISNLVETTWRC